MAKGSTLGLEVGKGEDILSFEKNTVILFSLLHMKTHTHNLDF